MHVDAHARIGTLLKGVLTDMRARAGAYKRVDAVRSELDDWVQCEHDRAAMPDEVFFDLDTERIPPEERPKLANNTSRTSASHSPS
ncbi:DUF5623 domain-containing protein [Mesorhizobium sp. AR07]|uniref:DUF5623 domain-containing protein n=1 Tax=Mesorhizobium sp. AR07 TaxID=2865838 RepID=UPI00215F654F|nr:DUF5623 domain-containing protein [Mesorhizobium sp. AR07]